MEVKVSVIVPVYNAEKYLEECIRSLLGQTLQECEFIFVNDGSVDGSRAMIERFQQEDNRIQLINQENQGVSVARNAGIEAARGEYIGFVDADDWVKADMMETLYQVAEYHRCDIVFSDYVGELGGRMIAERMEFPTGRLLDRDFIRKEILPVYLESDRLNSVCNKLYRHEVISNYQITFPSGIALGEDGWFNMQALSAANSACYVDYAGYHYRDTAGSATRNSNPAQYFARALRVYREPLPVDYEAAVQHANIRALRSKKLVHSCISLIHHCFEPSNPVSFVQKITDVRKMVHHSELQVALADYATGDHSRFGRYERIILSLMNSKSAVGLYGVTAYSRFRNQKVIGG
ncbi:glycosyltransferase [Paenibacillus sp. LHD-117]|uniref:glycosyltransferase n=1 Tax=Paenibacillus sp. LHD-117 TaxID=3071412 RepID=UPI0027E01365|nr:glycosyltransferase [Paenibacillus sp. LHD-117]MDQ6423262.1 glycosyltransferase [Paenibacillus sp. LHD-117]